MKKVLIFIAGFVIGSILMLVIAALIGNSSNGESSNNGMTFFEKEGDCISENSFEVFQVKGTKKALTIWHCFYCLTKKKMYFNFSHVSGMIKQAVFIHTESLSADL